MQFNTEKMALLQYHKSYLGFYIVAIRKNKKQWSSRDMLRIRWYHQAGKTYDKQETLGNNFFTWIFFLYFFSRLCYSLARRNKKNTPTRSAKKNSKKQIKHWGDQDWKAGKEKKNKMAVGYSVYFPVFYISLLSSNLLKLTKKNLSIWLINDKILLALVFKMDCICKLNPKWIGI